MPEKQPTILITDDSQTLRRILRQSVLDVCPGATIVEAADGKQALVALKEHEIDIVFLDVNMPEMSGLDVLELLRNKGNNVFVTLMSTEADAAVMKAGSELGSYDFLKKPFTPEQIATILASHKNLSRRKNVLIVDDSHVIRRIIYKVLANCRFDMLVSEVESGKEALTLLAGTHPDIVFLDYNMPGLDGIQAAQRLRAEIPGIKMVMISSQDLTEQREACRKAGIFALLKKPFFANEVDFVLHRLYGLNMPQSLEQTPNVTLLQD
ncbi:response regulator receiver domain-containing protein [Breoghania corrubedonensis]|uniref:Response regulator receiver domain-containing protein n=1 Tax=Breoghania corrubedonensis TaxID=665038 RepID=A0A2T5VH56_9HYPH|nr:response regulator [Breoghania corrubedonensis]PTW63066.1 response regulator receiver domain-containing protein [Breoghania corrubedonensis]